MSAYQHGMMVIENIPLAAGGAAGSSAIITHRVGRNALRVEVYEQASGAPFLTFEVSQPSVNQIIVGNTSAGAAILRLMIIFQERSEFNAEISPIDALISSGTSSGIAPVPGSLETVVFGSTPNANGGEILGTTLTLQPANATNPGGVSISTQTFAGNKTFSNAVTIPGTVANPFTVNTVPYSFPSVVGAAGTILTDVAGNGQLTWGTLNLAVRTEAANYIVAAGDRVILGNAADITFTLPTAVGITGKQYTIKKINNGGNLTISAQAGETIDDFSSKVISVQYTAITVVSNGANWVII
jgi:hypothetical protein